MDYTTSMMGSEEAAGLLAGFGIGGSLVSLLVCVFLLASLWKIFTKAGVAGWACLIPFYNLYKLYKIAGCSILWFILSFIPGVNVVATIVCFYNLSKAFGHGIGFMLGLMFIPYVFYPILGFGNSQYIGVAQ